MRFSMLREDRHLMIAAWIVELRCKRNRIYEGDEGFRRACTLTHSSPNRRSDPSFTDHFPATQSLSTV